MKMKKVRIKEAIQVGKKLSQRIFDLPCVDGALKDKETGQMYYMIRLAPDCHHTSATEGEWICEDYFGNWHVLTDYEFSINEAMPTGF